MAARLPHDKQALDKSSKLPGPGMYQGVYKSLCGKQMFNSMYKTTSNFSVGKSQRFSVPTKKTLDTSPASYMPLDNLNQNFRYTF